MRVSGEVMVSSVARRLAGALALSALALTLLSCQQNRPHLPLTTGASATPTGPVHQSPADANIVGKWTTPEDALGDPTDNDYEFFADGTASWAPSSSGMDSLMNQETGDGLSPLDAAAVKRMYRAFTLTWRREGGVFALTYHFDGARLSEAERKSRLFHEYFGPRPELATGEETRYLVLVGDRLMPCTKAGALLDEGDELIRVANP